MTEDTDLKPGDLVRWAGSEEHTGFGLVIAIDPSRDWFKATIFWSKPRRGKRIDGHPMGGLERCNEAG